MIRRDFLKKTVTVVGGLTAEISYGGPCAPLLDGASNASCTPQNNLAIRTGALSNNEFFLSDDGNADEVPNNTTPQNNNITWQSQGIYYDPVRGRMHQLDRQHTNGFTEHAYLDELTNAWVDVSIPAALDAGSSHWRQQAFDPTTGRIFYQKEATNSIFIYDPDRGWSETADEPSGGLTAGNSGPQSLGYHPNLFGPSGPGLLVINVWRFYAYNLSTDTWHTLNTSNMSTSNPLYDLDRGEGWYFPGRDELLITCRGKTNPNGENVAVAIAAGAGNETNLSTANSAEVRNKPAKQISGSSSNDKLNACFHPRQPNVLLAFDAASSTTYYTDDAAATSWNRAPFTHPFASQLTTDGRNTVGVLPQHGVVVGAAGIGTNNTKFVFWKVPTV